MNLQINSCDASIAEATVVLGYCNECRTGRYMDVARDEIDPGY